jgi:hypothetical protein
MSSFAQFAEESDEPVGVVPIHVARGATLTVALCALVLCFVVAAPALAKGHGSAVQVSLVEASRVLAPNASATYAARCPSSHPHPVGGEFDASSAGGAGKLALAASYPHGKRAWVVAVQNLSDQPQGYVAGVICLRARAKFAYPRTSYVVQPQGADGSSVSCPSAASHSLSAYFNVQSPADLGKALLDNFGTDNRGKHEFGVAGVKSSSGTPVGMIGGAVCTSLQTRFYGFDSTVAPGANDGQSSICPRNAPVAVGGFAFAKTASDDGALLVAGMGNIGRKGYAGVRNLTDHAVPYSAGALCVG